MRAASLLALPQLEYEHVPHAALDRRHMVLLVRDEDEGVAALKAVRASGAVRLRCVEGAASELAPSSAVPNAPSAASRAAKPTPDELRRPGVPPLRKWKSTGSSIQQTVYRMMSSIHCVFDIAPCIFATT